MCFIKIVYHEFPSCLILLLQNARLKHLTEFLVSNTFYKNQQDDIKIYITSKRDIETLLMKLLLSRKEQNIVLCHGVGF